MNETILDRINSILDEPNDYANDAFIILTPFFERYTEKYNVKLNQSALSELGYVLSSDTFLSNGINIHRVRYLGQLSFLAIKPYTYQFWQEHKMRNSTQLMKHILKEYNDKNVKQSQPLIPVEHQIKVIKPPKHLLESDYRKAINDLIDDYAFTYANRLFVCQTPLNRKLQEIFQAKIVKPRVRSILESMDYTDLRDDPEFKKGMFKTDGLPDISRCLPGEYRNKTAVFFHDSTFPEVKAMLDSGMPLSKALTELYEHQPKFYDAA